MYPASDTTVNMMRACVRGSASKLTFVAFLQRQRKIADHVFQRRASSRFRRPHLAACRRQRLRGHGRTRGNAGVCSGRRSKLHCTKSRRRCHKDALGSGLAPFIQQPNIGHDENIRRPRNGTTRCELRGSGKPAPDRARGLPQQRRGVGRRRKGLGTRDRVAGGGGNGAISA